MSPPADPSQAETARLRSVFQGMHDPAELSGVELSGLSPRDIQAILPVYNEKATNPTYGIFVDNSAGKVYGFQSGQNFGESTYRGLMFRRGTLSSIDTMQTNINFVTQEAHVEAQVSGFMRKQGIESGSLYINSSNPCLGEFGCNENLPDMLPPGSRLRVFATDAFGTWNGMPDRGDYDE